MQHSLPQRPAARRRTVVGAIALILGVAATSIGLSAGSTLAYTGPVITANTSDSNKEGYWGPGCTKLDQGASTSWTATADYSLVVLKAGNFDYAFSNVVKGDVLTIPQNISHFIFCPPAVTTTTQPEVTTTTQPEVTTTTQPEVTTTTQPEVTTTTQPEVTTTTQPEVTTTTQPEVTTTTQPEVTTTTQPEVTTTTQPEVTTTTAAAGESPTTTTEGPTTTEVAQIPPGPTTTALGSAGDTAPIVRELPRTGVDDTGPLVLVGMALVGLGLALVLSSRRPGVA
jgi:LPXTG-motif cell wall-anchored protein